MSLLLRGELRHFIERFAEFASSGPSIEGVFPADVFPTGFYVIVDPRYALLPLRPIGKIDIMATPFIRAGVLVL